jgi:endonuclease-3
MNTSLQNKIENIFSILSEREKNPETELKFCNEYTLLIAIILSAQSTDVGVNKATSKLFEIAKSPKEMLKLGEAGLKNYIKTLGLYNSKAKNIISLSNILINKYNSNVPASISELETLPGVGSKTARVFMNCAHKEPVIAVDTHVFRVSRRLGIVKSNSPKLAEKELNSEIPDKWKLHAHHWLILHGRYTCKARNPSCSTCSISSFCNFYKGRIDGK